jgi:hypothetical protein
MARPGLTPALLSAAWKLAAACQKPASGMEADGWGDITRLADVRPFPGSAGAAPLIEKIQKAPVIRRWRRAEPHIPEDSPPEAERGCKTLVTAAVRREGMAVIAISFAGTGARLFDWLINFRISRAEGFHKGFMQMARQFESRETGIVFPGVAKALSMDRLTLADVLNECREADSRFRILLTGYSQGGAVLQAYAHLKLRETGVRPEYLIGIGFASPSAAFDTAESRDFAYPLFHIVNSDDLVPRIGSRVHCGQKLVFSAYTPFRSACGPLPGEGAEADVRRETRRILSRMADMPSCIAAGVAYLHILMKQTEKDIQRAADALQIGHLPIGRLLTLADRRLDLLRFIVRRAEAAYRELTGSPCGDGWMAESLEVLEEAAGRAGMVALTADLARSILYPHMLTALPDVSLGSYEAIAAYGFHALRAYTAGTAADAADLWTRRVSKAFPVRLRGISRRGYSRARAFIGARG